MGVRAGKSLGKCRGTGVLTGFLLKVAGAMGHRLGGTWGTRSPPHTRGRFCETDLAGLSVTLDDQEEHGRWKARVCSEEFGGTRLRFGHRGSSGRGLGMREALFN